MGSPHNIRLNGFAALPMRIAAEKLTRKLRCRIGTASNFRDKTNVRLKRVLGDSSIPQFNLSHNALHTEKVLHSS